MFGFYVVKWKPIRLFLTILNASGMVNNNKILCIECKFGLGQTISCSSPHPNSSTNVKCECTSRRFHKTAQKRYRWSIGQRTCSKMKYNMSNFFVWWSVRASIDHTFRWIIYKFCLTNKYLIAIRILVTLFGRHHALGPLSVYGSDWVWSAIFAYKICYTHIFMRLQMKWILHVSCGILRFAGPKTHTLEKCDSNSHHMHSQSTYDI